MSNKTDSDWWLYDTPYVKVVNHSELLNRCSHCLKAGTTACHLCHIVAYCGTQCYEQDAHLHRFECASYQKLDAQGRTAFQEQPEDQESVSDYARLMCRMLTRMQDDDGVQAEMKDFGGLELRRVQDMMNHAEDIANSPMELRFSEVFDFYCKYYVSADTESVLKRPKDEMRKWFGTLRVNVFSISEDSLDGSDDLGLGMYVNMSRFDSACYENMITFQKGLTLVAHPNSPAVMELPQSQRFISYLEGTQHDNSLYGVLLRSERQQKLRCNYFFDCKCDTCEDPKLDKMQRYSVNKVCKGCKKKEMIWKADDIFECLACLKKVRNEQSGHRVELLIHDITETLDVVSQVDDDETIRSLVDELLEDAEMVLDTSRNVYVLRLYEQLFRICRVASNKMGDCVTFGEKILPVYQLYLPSHSLFIADTAFSVSQASAEMKDFSKQLKFLKIARVVWRIRCGESSEAVQRLNEMIAHHRLE